MTERPVLHLLSGLPCSGKTTFARRQQAAGIACVSVDAMMIESAGRLGVDYLAARHLELLEPVVAAAHVRLMQHLEQGDDVVFDHGVGTRAERDLLKQLATDHGATWTLVCFDLPLEVLRARCRVRNDRADAVPISDQALDYLASGWERPSGEGEIVITAD